MILRLHDLLEHGDGPLLILLDARLDQARPRDESEDGDDDKKKSGTRTAYNPSISFQPAFQFRRSIKLSALNKIISFAVSVNRNLADKKQSPTEVGDLARRRAKGLFDGAVAVSDWRSP